MVIYRERNNIERMRDREHGCRRRRTPESVTELTRDARKYAGLSQMALGRFCDMGQGRVSSLENGRCALSVELLERIAAALGKKLEIRFVDEAGD